MYVIFTSRLVLLYKYFHRQNALGNRGFWGRICARDRSVLGLSSTWRAVGEFLAGALDVFMYDLESVDEG